MELERLGTQSRIERWEGETRMVGGGWKGSSNRLGGVLSGWHFKNKDQIENIYMYLFTVHRFS